MSVNSKAKGNTFERKMANLLSDRFADHTGLKSSFRRNVDSGSFFGRSNQVRIETHGTEHACFGDLMTPASFRYTVECKHYKAPPSFNAILKQDWKQLDEWLGQAKQDGLNAGKDWLVIVKFNNIDEFVVVAGTHPLAVMSYRGDSIIPLKSFLDQADSLFFADDLK